MLDFEEVAESSERLQEELSHTLTLFRPIMQMLQPTFDEAQQVLLDKGFRHLPVVDGDTILGIVSLRRIMGGRRPTAD